MITVIIPVLNEEETIYDVVRFALENKNVSEVIVEDDKSPDHTINRQVYKIDTTSLQARYVAGKIYN